MSLIRSLATVFASLLLMSSVQAGPLLTAKDSV
jgi:hypothetical protein